MQTNKKDFIHSLNLKANTPFPYLVLDVKNNIPSPRNPGFGAALCIKHFIEERPMKLTHIDHLVITTQNLEKCLEFYSTILDMHIEECNGRYALKFGNCKINIHQSKGEFQPAASNPSYGSADFCLIAEGKIEDIKAQIEQRGYVLELDIVKRNGAKGEMQSIYLRDFDGNLVEIACYPSS